jgi:nitrile hydratase accessory protein
MLTQMEYLKIPRLPLNQEGPVFDEPWQLTAFGIVVALHKKGLFEWKEWVGYLSAEIASGKTYDVEDTNGIYYRQWLNALERLVTEKDLATAAELLARKEEWRYVDEHRDFGQPLNLHNHPAHHDHGHTHGGHHHHHGHDHHHGNSGKDGDSSGACPPPATRISH